MAITPTTAQRLAAEGIADSAQDLRQLSAAELRLGREAPLHLARTAFVQRDDHQVWPIVERPVAAFSVAFDP